MARKRRITKYITVEQMDFLKYLETEEIQVFSIEDTKNFHFQGEITNELFEKIFKRL